MTSLIAVRMPSSYKKKLEARDRDLQELGALMVASKNSEIQSEEALKELSSLADLCETTAASMLTSMGLDGLLLTPPDIGITPYEQKEAIRHRVYSLLTASALMSVEYKKLINNQMRANEVLHSMRGGMSQTEAARHAPRNLESHIGHASNHLKGDESDNDDDSTELPHHQALGGEASTAMTRRPSPSSLKREMR